MVSRKSSITFAGGVDMQPRSLNKYYHQRTKRPCLSWVCVYVFVRARHLILHFSVSAVSANAVFLHASLALVCRLFGWRIWNVCARVLVHVFSFRLRDFRSDFVHIWLLSAIYVIWRKCHANTKWRWNKDNERTEHLVLGRGEVEGGRGKWRGERYFIIWVEPLKIVDIIFFVWSIWIKSPTLWHFPTAKKGRMEEMTILLFCERPRKFSLHRSKSWWSMIWQF